jgi:hypothetical protein
MSEPAFWRNTALADMSKAQWESLCDGCAKCCLVKLEDEDTAEVAYTNVVCRYMDEANCQCTQYQNRNTLVPHCVWLKPDMVEEFFWLPDTCAYRLVHEGHDLPDWHHLRSGSRSSVHEAGASVKNKVLNEQYIPDDELQEYIVHWVE